MRNMVCRHNPAWQEIDFWSKSFLTITHPYLVPLHLPRQKFPKERNLPLSFVGRNKEEQLLQQPKISRPFHAIANFSPSSRSGCLWTHQQRGWMSDTSACLSIGSQLLNKQLMATSRHWRNPRSWGPWASDNVVSSHNILLEVELTGWWDLNFFHGMAPFLNKNRRLNSYIAVK